MLGLPLLHAGGFTQHTFFFRVRMTLSKLCFNQKKTQWVYDLMTILIPSILKQQLTLGWICSVGFFLLFYRVRLTLRISWDPPIERGLWICFSQGSGISKPLVTWDPMILRVDYFHSFWMMDSCPWCFAPASGWESLQELFGVSNTDPHQVFGCLGLRSTFDSMFV